MSRRPLWLAALALGTAILVPTLHSASPAAAAAISGQGIVLPDGRLATPAGSGWDAMRQKGDASYDLGDFPLGLSLSPNGKLAVASLNGFGQGIAPGFNSTCQADTAGAGGVCPGQPLDKIATKTNHTPDEGLDVIDLATGKVVQVVAVPTVYDKNKARVCGTTMNCFGIGVAFSPDGNHVYATGAGTDKVYDFAVTGTTLKLAHTVAVPSINEQLPAAPVLGKTDGNPRGLAVTPDGKSLLVTSEFDSTLEMYDVSGGKAPSLVAQGLMPGGVAAPAPVAYLYAVTTSPDSQYAYITAQGTGVVYAVNLTLFKTSGIISTTSTPVSSLSAAVVPVATTVPGLDHPTGLAVSPDGTTLAVTGSNSDNVVFLPLLADVPHLPAVTVATKAADHKGTLGAVANAVAWSKDSKTAYVALAGDNAIAVVNPATGTQTGAVPTGWYPTAVAIGPKDGRIYALAAKGLGSRYVPVLGYTARPGTSLPAGASIPSADYYDGDNMPGLLTRFTVPTAARLASYTAQAKADILHATGLDHRPADSPIPAAVGGTSPIKHVVYIVRENRTYDQVLGDLVKKRKDSNGDPSNAVLAPSTPNAHAISNRFATSDNFFSDGEASVQGHWWTSSANSADYMEKSWRQYYSPRNRPYDPIGTVVNPPGCSIFQHLATYQLTHPTFTFKDYGELEGALSINTNTGALTSNTCGGAGPAGAGSVPTDPKYPNQLTLVPDDRNRADEFLKDSGLTPAGANANNGNSLRNFNYLIMSEDHTSGLSGVQTPRSEVAQNDQAVGMVVSALSKSADWSSTAVFVVEDDSQDGFDHVDGHRNVLLVASPWTKQISGDSCTTGYIGHAHYDQASVLRTMELILGVGPMSAYDASAPPLYDLFQPTSQLAKLTKGSLAPYAVHPEPKYVDETVASLPKTSKTAALKAASASLNLTGVDRAGPELEAVLWESLSDKPLPADLVARMGSNDDAAGSVVGSQLAVGTTAAAPALSTLTGKPVTAATRCSAVGVLPAAFHHGTKPPTTQPGGHLPTTGLGTVLPAAALLLLSCAWIGRRRLQ